MQVNNAPINSSLHGMMQAQMQLEEVASNLAEVSNAVGDPQLQEVSAELIEAITAMIPTTIAYEANAEAISTQNAVQASLINIKA